MCVLDGRQGFCPMQGWVQAWAQTSHNFFFDSYLGRKTDLIGKALLRHFGKYVLTPSSDFKFVSTVQFPYQFAQLLFFILILTFLFAQHEFYLIPFFAVQVPLDKFDLLSSHLKSTPNLSIYHRSKWSEQIFCFYP